VGLCEGEREREGGARARQEYVRAALPRRAPPSLGLRLPLSSGTSSHFPVGCGVVGVRVWCVRVVKMGVPACRARAGWSGRRAPAPLSLALILTIFSASSAPATRDSRDSRAVARSRGRDMVCVCWACLWRGEHWRAREEGNVKKKRSRHRGGFRVRSDAPLRGRHPCRKWAVMSTNGPCHVSRGAWGWGWRGKERGEREWDGPGCVLQMERMKSEERGPPSSRSLARLSPIAPSASFRAHLRRTAHRPRAPRTPTLARAPSQACTSKATTGVLPPSYRAPRET